MALSLRTRLFVAQLAVVALALVLTSVLAARNQRGWLERRDSELLEQAAARALAVIVRDPVTAARDWQATALALAAVHGHRVTLVDPTGHVLGDSDVEGERIGSLENHADRPEIRAALAGRVGRDLRRSATIDRDLLYVAIPAARATGLGALRFAEPRAEITRQSASLAWPVAWAAGTTLVAMLLLVTWLTGRHAGRIAELERITARLGAGEAGARARELPADEVGRLGRAINRMAVELRARVDALERERDEREQILAHMSDGVALVDRSGRVLHANRSLAEIFGVPLPPLPGTPLQAVARSPELDDLLRRAQAGEETVEMDLRLWAPRQRLVRATTTRLREHPDGAVLLVLHDLSEVELLNRVRQDFVANVSHELKTPLTSVRGYAETLLEGGLEDRENREEFVLIIREQATRLQGLVEDLLSLAELERPDARLRLETLDLREVFERQIEPFRDRAVRAGLTLSLEPGPPVPVRADRGRMEQVVANLLDNAVKYTERGAVRVRVGGAETHVFGEVRDTGPGIPAADLGRIFERFYRVDKARSREKGGTGLGLSIVKHILALHGGEISVESEPGKGSTFRFEIPRQSRESASD